MFNIKKIAKELKESPIFHLSLSSKELFHSNFLAWFCEQYPVEGKNIFSDFLVTPDASGWTKISKVQREKENIDLTLQFANEQQNTGVLYIENKVKSIPKIEQLEEYSTKLNKEKKGYSYKAFMLLSLTEPSFFNGQAELQIGDALWQYVSYERLANLIVDVIPTIENPYHKALVLDYVFYIRHLYNLQLQFKLHFAGSEVFFLGADTHVAIEELRIHDLVEKYRFEQLAGKVKSELLQLGYKLTGHNPLKIHDVSVGTFWIDAGMSRSQGLFDLKFTKNFIDGNPQILGVQIQGEQFRLMTENISAEESLQLKKSGTWFDFGLLLDSQPNENYSKYLAREKESFYGYKDSKTGTKNFKGLRKLKRVQSQ